jgi:hypothetical protein
VLSLILARLVKFFFFSSNLRRTAAHKEFYSVVGSFMADSQVPWGVDALSGAVTDPTRSEIPNRATIWLHDG